MGILKKLEKLELHHQIIAFLLIILATICITRFLVYYVIDPNPVVFGWELHHFDYGLTLLIITSLLLLFGKKHLKLYLLFIAISLGLIIDELWFVKKSLGHGNPAFYNPSFVYVVILAIIITLFVMLIHYLSKKK